MCARAAHLGPEKRRPLVLDAALGVFLEHGYEGASMDRIASAAGVSKPVVYDCYGSKAELYEALMDREEQRVLAEIRTRVPEDVDLGDPQETLTAVLLVFLRAVERSPDVYRIIVLAEGGANSAVAQRVEAGRRAQIDGIARLALRWAESDQEAWFVATTAVGLSEAGARMLLARDFAWTAEGLALRLGRLAASPLADRSG